MGYDRQAGAVLGSWACWGSIMWGLFRAHLGSTWDPGLVEDPLCGAHLGSRLQYLGLIWGPLLFVWGALGHIWGSFDFGPYGSYFGPRCCPLGAIVLLLRATHCHCGLAILLLLSLWTASCQSFDGNMRLLCTEGVVSLGSGGCNK